MNRFTLLFISISLFMAAGSSKAQVTTPTDGTQFSGPMVQNRALMNDGVAQREIDSVMVLTDNSDDSKIGSIETENTALEPTAKQLEEKLEYFYLENTANWFDHPIKLLLAGSTGLIVFTTLIIFVTSRRNIPTRRRRSTQKPPAKSSKEIIDSHLTPYYKRIEDLEAGQKILRNELELINDQIKQSASMSKLKTMAVINPDQFQKVEPPPAVVSMPQRQSTTGPSKHDLISSLNEGDHKKVLRNTFSSELNITRESEDDIFTGRSISTKLEVVPGGGSYLLVVLQGQSLLFPTIQSLNAYTAVERSKGLFDYERRTTLSSPQLLEPALLEGSGDRWMIKEKGLIGIP